MAGALEPRLTEAFTNLAPYAGAAAVDLTIDLAAMDEAEAASPAVSGLGMSGVLETSADGRHVHHRQPHCVAHLDRVARTIHARLRSCDGDSTAVARPLQALLSIACADRDIDLVHGALVSREGSGLLIAGSNGAGKSTAAIAALLDGWDYFGDDCVAVSQRDGAFVGSSVFASACLDPGHLSAFAPQLPAEQAAPGEKTFVRVIGRVPEADTCIRAIVVPRVTGGDDVTVRPLDARAALIALGPSTILRRAVPAGPVLARLRTLAMSRPRYALEMGPIDRIGGRLREILAAHA